jgi:replicative DNA helicase
MLNQNKNPWTPKFQRELLVLLLQLPEVYGQYSGIWKPNYFDDAVHREIAQAYLTIRALGNDHPAKTTLQQEILKDVDNRLPIPLDKQAAIDETEILYRAQPQNPRYSVHVVRQWARDQELIYAVDACLNHLQAGEVDKLRPLIDAAYAIGTDTSQTGITVTPATRDPGQTLLDTLVGDFLPIGMPSLERVLEGGIRPGEMITVVGIPGVFKSGTMLNWMMPALQQPYGRKVTYISLEMSEKKVYGRFCFRVSKKSKDFLKVDLGKFNAAFNTEIANYCGSLHIKNFGNGTIDIVELKAYLDQLDHREHETGLLIVDYPQIMKKDRSLQDFNAIGDLYAGIRSIAIEREIPVIAAAQLNREAFKKLEAITMAEISASMDIARHSDYIVAILQSEEMRKENKMRLKLLKNRNEETGVIINIDVDYPLYSMYDMGEYVPADDSAAATNSTTANTTKGAGRAAAQQQGSFNLAALKRRIQRPKPSTGGPGASGSNGGS